ncbi:unnamed protein product, partial [Amoebophrya sp. A25]
RVLVGPVFSVPPVDEQVQEHVVTTQGCTAVEERGPRTESRKPCRSPAAAFSVGVLFSRWQNVLKSNAAANIVEHLFRNCCTTRSRTRMAEESPHKQEEEQRRPECE